MMANAPLMKNDKENKEKNLPGFEYNAVLQHKQLFLDAY